MRHSWLLCLPLAASLAPVDQIKTLLKLGRIDGATGYHELDSGFCNSVYRVDTHKKPVVVKIYSAMAKARCAGLPRRRRRGGGRRGGLDRRDPRRHGLRRARGRVRGR